MKYEEFHKLHRAPQIVLPDLTFRGSPRGNDPRAWIGFFEELREASKEPVDKQNMQKGVDLVKLAIECNVTNILAEGHTVNYGMASLRYLEFEMVFSCIEDEMEFNSRIRDIA